MNSTLGNTTEVATARLGLKANRATAPLNFSDHYPFVTREIPALWIVQDDGGPPTKAGLSNNGSTLHEVTCRGSFDGNQRRRLFGSTF